MADLLTADERAAVERYKTETFASASGMLIRTNRDYSDVFDLADALLRVLPELDRLAEENKSLRASLGQPTGAEPFGCPCPGACSATALAARCELLENAADRVTDEAVMTGKVSMESIRLLAETLTPTPADAATKG